VPRFLLQTSDAAVTEDDLVAECYCHLLTKAPGYEPEKALFLDWVFFKAMMFFRTYFRKLTDRRQLRKNLMDENRKARKGRVQHGRTLDAPDDEGERTADMLEGSIYTHLGREEDTRPADEWMIDLKDLVAQLPEDLRTVMELVVQGVDNDQIGWRLDLHPTTVATRKRRGTEALRDMLQ
jgi:RNA polymerase sigma factor (sigma-70 family)